MRAHIPASCTGLNVLRMGSQPSVGWAYPRLFERDHVNSDGKPTSYKESIVTEAGSGNIIGTKHVIVAEWLVGQRG